MYMHMQQDTHMFSPAGLQASVPARVRMDRQTAASRRRTRARTLATCCACTDAPGDVSVRFQCAMFTAGVRRATLGGRIAPSGGTCTYIMYYIGSKARCMCKEWKLIRRRGQMDVRLWFLNRAPLPVFASLFPPVLQTAQRSNATLV